MKQAWAIAQLILVVLPQLALMASQEQLPRVLTQLIWKFSGMLEKCMPK